MKSVNSAKVYFLFLLFHNSNAVVSDKEYALLPELFHQDNFDKCMLLGYEALYCSFEYQLKPLNAKSSIWKTLQELSSDDYNYRHDILRHWICVPFTCPNVTVQFNDMEEIRREINDCYDRKMKYYELKGSIEQLDCSTNVPKYPIDWIDVAAAIFLISYITLTILISLCEALAESWWPEGYKTFTNTYCGKVTSSFSLSKNWNRLTTINKTPELEYLHPIQGIRILNSFLVILSHTCLVAVILPVMNTKYTENINSKYLNLFLSSGPLCVGTFFLISSILLSYGIFTQFERREFTPKAMIMIMVNRYIRLTPAMAITILFNATLWRHLGNGPNWNKVVGREYLRCKKNWWTNLIYLNNVIDPYNMCTASFWYMAEDTQYFIFLLVLLWFIKKHETSIWYILGGVFALYSIATFTKNYVNDFEALLIPKPERVYDMKNLLGNRVWQEQFISIIGNACGAIFGVGFGYIFYKTRNTKLFEKRKKMWKIIFYLLTFVPALSIILIPNWYIFIARYPHDTLIASILSTVSRPIFIFSVGFMILGCMHGIGGPSNSVIRWMPLYVLGRTAYGVYLVHSTIIISRVALARSPTYVNDTLILHNLLGDLGASFLIGCLVTLFFEMPMSALQKLFVPSYPKESLIDNKKDQ